MNFENVNYENNFLGTFREHNVESTYAMETINLVNEKNNDNEVVLL